jgi:hypothetical protein
MRRSWYARHDGVRNTFSQLALRGVFRKRASAREGAMDGRGARAGNPLRGDSKYSRKRSHPPCCTASKRSGRPASFPIPDLRSTPWRAGASAHRHGLISHSPSKEGLKEARAESTPPDHLWSRSGWALHIFWVARTLHWWMRRPPILTERIVEIHRDRASTLSGPGEEARGP